MSASFLFLARWFTWCRTRTSIGVRSFTPAAAMQRTTQRWKAWPQMIIPYSNSETSAPRPTARWADETMRGGARGGGRFARLRGFMGSSGGRRRIAAFCRQVISNLLTWATALASVTRFP